ncbi:MAG TPA: M20/M25/M40 family metallo-hydrolase [Gaiellaceae bacterium]|nr:M20/M25/M40 family metallo-hydrolase [Gaiellaceae bacterium]
MPSDVVDLFCELAAVPSPSGDERAVADRVLRYLRDLGLAPDEDDVGAEIGSTMGNVYVRLDATAAGEPLLLCAHLDTVPPTAAIEPEIGDDGFIRNTAGTILGADDKAAVAVLLEATRRLLAEGRPHAGVELLFTPKEEVGLVGAYAFDETRLTARTGYVYDQAAPIGTIVLGAPYSQSLEVTFHGRASHAGMYPDEGRSAIAAAARAISELRLGRVDEDSTANVGTITGGTATNIVPEWCTFVAEVRSHDERKLADLVREMQDAITYAGTVSDCATQTQARKSYRGYRFARTDRAVALAAEALAACGFEPSYELSGGAADANVFNERGLEVVNLANGMIDIHTPAERIAAADLDAMVDVTLALIEAARA